MVLAHFAAVAVLLLVTYVPDTALLLPRMMMGYGA